MDGEGKHPDLRVAIKRAYDPPEPGDGYRVLVDRLWPRGVTRAGLRIDEWLKDVAPSSELRKWYGHEPERWPEFRRRFEAELEEPARLALLDRLRARAATGPVTLVTATRDVDRSAARVLLDQLGGRRAD